MAAELMLSEWNRHRLGSLASVFEDGAGSEWFKRAGWLARIGLATRLMRKQASLFEHIASVCFMAAALCYRFAWVRSGQTSADDDEAVARMARERVTPR